MRVYVVKANDLHPMDINGKGLHPPFYIVKPDDIHPLDDNVLDSNSSDQDQMLGVAKK